MSEHHLSDSDCAAPPNVVIDTYFELSFITIVLDGGEEDLRLLDVVLEQWLEFAPVAEPKQGPELLLKRVLNLRNLMLDAVLALVVNVEGVVEQHYRQVTQLLNLDFVCLEEF